VATLAEVAAGLRSAGRPTALLAGSGIAQAAGLPTGQELVRRVAARLDTDCGADPVCWYVGATGMFPNYFRLVRDSVSGCVSGGGTGGGTGEALPSGVFERPAPTRAHRAIATLAGAGLVGPILTTNLDRLLERSLAAQGIPYQVAHNVITMELLAARPNLAAHPVPVIKLHGDYRDISISHAAPELHTYPCAVDALLRRVFASFDVVVCGWSASWDMPLAKALRAASDRRLRWLQCGPVLAAAAGIIAARQPDVVTIANADAGLTELCRLLVGTEP